MPTRFHAYISRTPKEAISPTKTNSPQPTPPHFCRDGKTDPNIDTCIQSLKDICGIDELPWATVAAAATPAEGAASATAAAEGAASATTGATSTAAAGGAASKPQQQQQGLEQTESGAAGDTACIRRGPGGGQVNKLSALFVCQKPEHRSVKWFFSRCQERQDVK